MEGGEIVEGRVGEDYKILKRKDAMRCDVIQNKLVAYLDHELNPNTRDNIEYHLKTCSKCAVRLEETKKILSFYRSIPELEPEPGYVENIVHVSSSEKVVEKKLGLISKLGKWFHIQNRVVRWAPAAISLLIILLLIGTLFSKHFVLKKRPPLEKSATVYTYSEYLAKARSVEAKQEFGRYSFDSIY